MRTIVPVLVLFEAVAAAATPSNSALAGQEPETREIFPIAIDSVTTLEFKEAGIGNPIGVMVGLDGNLVVADIAKSQVVKMSPTGDVLWSVGRHGPGPAEFQILYRIARGYEGNILAFDVATQQITIISPAGEILDRKSLYFPFSNIDALVSMKNGRIAITGVSFQPGPARGYAIHLFSRGLDYIKSFGPLPDARDPNILQVWGAGGLTLGGNGDLIYTRRLPYEIYRYAPTGELRHVSRPPFGEGDRPDDAYEISGEGDRTRIRHTAEPPLRPLPAVALDGGWVLGGRRMPDGTVAWDLFAPNGTLEASRTLPAQWKAVAGFDKRRDILWVRGENALEPALFGLFVTLEVHQTS